mmetsp:Transcript_149739/g.417354  ORF Transcript_149739/g.417354 Transcript_149739/m.417354 type:complete len:253 (+) Transcript_149739:262-1020(+)
MYSTNECLFGSSKSPVWTEFTRAGTRVHLSETAAAWCKSHAAIAANGRKTSSDQKFIVATRMPVSWSVAMQTTRRTHSVVVCRIRMPHSQALETRQMTACSRFQSAAYVLQSCAPKSALWCCWTKSKQKASIISINGVTACKNALSNATARPLENAKAARLRRSRLSSKLQSPTRCVSTCMRKKTMRAQAKIWNTPCHWDMLCQYAVRPSRRAYSTSNVSSLPKILSRTRLREAKSPVRAPTATTTSRRYIK